MAEKARVFVTNVIRVTVSTAENADDATVFVDYALGKVDMFLVPVNNVRDAVCVLKSLADNYVTEHRSVFNSTIFVEERSDGSMVILDHGSRLYFKNGKAVKAVYGLLRSAAK